MFHRVVVASLLAIALVGALLGSAIVFSSAASAALPSGSIIPDPTGQTYSSGQNINVVVPANDTFSSTDGLGNNNSDINVLECSAPNGVIPTQPSACDGNTIQGNTILPDSDGSFTYDGYTVYALPDSISLGESPDSPVACGSTAATECILYIGNNQNDFTQPHLWSEPFFVQANSDDGGENPPSETPEVPYAILLPIAAMGLLGAALLARRRRAARL
jgi:MYXO-CTERM domain-containing protein